MSEGCDIRGYRMEPAASDGRLTLETGLAEHHSYEQAWAYYAKMFGFQTSYAVSNKQQK